MAVCCCTLQTVTYVAAAITIFNFLLFTPLDITIIIGIKAPNLLNSSDISWNKFVNGLNQLNEPNILSGLLGLRIFLHILWLITVPLIVIGNATKRRQYLLPWEIIAIIKLIFMLLLVILFLLQYNQCGIFDELTIWMKEQFISPTDKTGEKFALFILLLNISDGGPIFWLMMTVFICYVHIRGWQILYRKKAESLLVNDSQFHMLTCRIPRAKMNENSRYDNNNLDSNMLHGNNCHYKSYPTYSTAATTPTGGIGSNIIPVQTRCYDNLGYTP